MSWKNAFSKTNRYYETERGILYLGDCCEILSRFPNNSIDLILTDIPYGVTQNKYDTKLDYSTMWHLIKQVRKKGARILLFGYGKPFAELVLSNKNEFRYELVWDKVLSSGFLNANRMPLRVHELIAVFYDKLEVYNPQYSYGKPNHSKGQLNKKYKNQNYGEYVDIENIKTNKKYPKSILTFQKPHPSKSDHPTQKPVSLMEYLIKTYSNEGDLVLDFTCGSGTTLVAAERLNRRWIGIEINEEYCQIAKQNLNIVSCQKRLIEEV